MAAFEKAEDVGILALIALILGGIAFASYEIYNYFTTGAGGETDPTTGQSTGLFNGIVNSIDPQNFAGGGADTGTSETYTGALSESIAHPFQTLGTIFGIGEDSGGN